MTKNILVTGSTGFIGNLLVPHLNTQGYTITAPTRTETGEIGPDTNWAPHLKNVDTIIHLAGRAHVMNEDAYNSLQLYRDVNYLGTRNLAKQAIDCGVKRFIFASTVKVMGESSLHPLSTKDIPNPIDPYGVSKLEAENSLMQFANEMDVVTLRLPLVYGPGVKGNFNNLLRLLQEGLPLPFGAINNRRSMIFSDNLISAIEASLTAPPGIYFPNDHDDLSTTELASILTIALGCKSRLLPIPVIILKLLGQLSGKSAMIQRLTGDLTTDGRIGDWIPPFNAKEGLIATANHFKKQDAKG